MIIQQPDQLLQFIKNSPDLARLFEGINIQRLSQKLSEYEQHTHESTPKPETPKKQTGHADLDKVSQLFP